MCSHHSKGLQCHCYYYYYYHYHQHQKWHPTLTLNLTMAIGKPSLWQPVTIVG